MWKNKPIFEILKIKKVMHRNFAKPY